MSVLILFSLLVAVIGGAFYYFSQHPKRAMLGLVAFGCGLLVFLQQLPTKAFHFGIGQ